MFNLLNIRVFSGLFILAISKHEARIPKQIRMLKILNSKRSKLLIIRIISNFLFWSLMISNFDIVSANFIKSGDIRNSDLKRAN
jgi:hypothetical protein